jgi:hypothetical protein
LPSDKQKAWQADQLAKSHFFHQKLHQWGLLEIQDSIEAVKGNELAWNTPVERAELGISESAWHKVIHQGMKPVRVFAHPSILTSLERSVSYYRMLSMVSQKSTPHAGADTKPYEAGERLPSYDKALIIARQLNAIISQLIETDETIDFREFDMWRGMAAGSQAQGSWQNKKGDQGEEGIRSIVKLRLARKDLLADDLERTVTFPLRDGRRIVFASDPDIACYRGELIQVAVEIKGGIDQAGVHERYGAIGKSFEKPKKANPNCTTILIIQAVSLTRTARDALNSNADIDHWFTLEDILIDEQKREGFLSALSI